MMNELEREILSFPGIVPPGQHYAHGMVMGGRRWKALVGCGCLNMSTGTVPPFAVLENQSTLCFNHSKEQLIKSGGGLRRQEDVDHP